MARKSVARSSTSPMAALEALATAADHTLPVKIDAIDEAQRALIKAAGIAYACQQAMLHGRDSNDGDIGNALWAACDLLKDAGAALRGRT